MQVWPPLNNPYADLKQLVDPKADGPIIGFYGECPIAAAVVDNHGHRFVYAGAAPRCHSGRLDFTALGPGEWIVEPGLLYVVDRKNRKNALPGACFLSGRRALQNLREALIGWL